MCTSGLTIVISIFLSTCAFAEREGACIKLDRMGIVGKSIWAHANKIRGYHNCESRNYIENDINNDGEKDLLVTYIISGACYENKKWRPGACSNDDTEFLAVFLKHKRRYKKPIIKKVGALGLRYIKKISAKDSTIILDTIEYYDHDPLCCPSKRSLLLLQLKDSTLVEKK